MRRLSAYFFSSVPQARTCTSGLKTNSGGTGSLPCPSRGPQVYGQARVVNGQARVVYRPVRVVYGQARVVYRHANCVTACLYEETNALTMLYRLLVKIIINTNFF